MIIGLGLSLVSAFGTILGFLFKQRGARLAPPVRASHPLRSAADLFRSRWFTLGWLVSLLAWLSHVGALSLAPLSLVQAVLSGGLVFLAVFAERWFGVRLGLRQWMGLTATTIGLVIIGLTGTGRSSSHASLSALITLEGAIFVLGASLMRASVHHRCDDRRQALLLATTAGLLFGASDVAIKQLSHGGGPVLGLISPWTLTAAISFVISFYASARSLQLGAPVEVIAITSVAANLSAVIGGILVFGEPIGSGAMGVTARVVAFCLVIFGAALMPAPLRAAPHLAAAASAA